MLHPDKFATHYSEKQRCRYLCPEKGCPACDVEIRLTEHVYLPVWDAQNRRIAILTFDTREDGPARKILAFLETHRERLADVVAVIKCTGNGKFTIMAHEPLPETDRGAQECEDFCNGLEAGTIDLRDVVNRLTVEEISRLPEVEEKSKPVVGAPVAPATDNSDSVAAGGPVGAPVDPDDNDAGEA